MTGKKTIDSFFRKTGSQNVEDCANSEPSTHIGETSTVEPEYRPIKSPRVEVQEFDKSTLVRDPALRIVMDLQQNIAPSAFHAIFFLQKRIVMDLMLSLFMDFQPRRK